MDLYSNDPKSNFICIILFTDERRARLIEYLKKTYHITKLPDPQEIDIVK
jgi:hypothetical protein